MIVRPQPPADPAPLLTREQQDAILQYDTCTIANAIECFGVRLRNEGFTRPGLNCVIDSGRRVLGHAVTFRVRTSDPPLTGGKFGERTDWWSEVQALPSPKIAIFQNVDEGAPSGACLGDVHAAILKALGCCGAITNGSVRDVDALVELDFPVYAQSISVSHSYMHIVDYGGEVEILGLPMRQGDLVFADCYGVIAIPAAIAPDLPKVAQRIRNKDRRIIDFCQSPDFTVENLHRVIQEGRMSDLQC